MPEYCTVQTCAYLVLFCFIHICAKFEHNLLSALWFRCYKMDAFRHSRAFHTGFCADSLSVSPIFVVGSARRALGCCTWVEKVFRRCVCVCASFSVLMHLCFHCCCFRLLFLLFLITSSLSCLFVLLLAPVPGLLLRDFLDSLLHRCTLCTASHK